jgi:hypothetical protein
MIDIIFFTSETILFFSFLMSSIISLRILVCVAQIGFISAVLLIGFDLPGMKATFTFSCLTFFVNAIHIFRLLYVKMPVTIPDKYKTAYQKRFNHFTPREFLILLEYSKLKSVKDYLLIQENKSTDLILLIGGKVNILIGNKVITELLGYDFLGEISFLTNTTSIASVQSLGHAEFFVWNRRQLQRLEKKYPAIFYKLYDILLKNLVLKLSAQNDLLASSIAKTKIL